jgi:hypothetical protein
VLFGVLLGAPTLKLRGDYLAIVTLGFGEIVRIFLNNLRAVQPHQRAEGPHDHRLDQGRGHRFRQHLAHRGARDSGTIKYYYFLPRGAGADRDPQPAASRIRASAARGRRSAKTSSPPARWASTRAT